MKYDFDLFVSFFYFLIYYFLFDCYFAVIFIVYFLLCYCFVNIFVTHLFSLSLSALYILFSKYECTSNLYKVVVISRFYLWIHWVSELFVVVVLVVVHLVNTLRKTNTLVVFTLSIRRIKNTKQNHHKLLVEHNDSVQEKQIKLGREKRRAE